jgi:RND family efflux transporter MFP subunit
MARTTRKWWIWGPLMVSVLSGVGWAYLHGKQAMDLTDPAQARRLGRPIPVRTALVTEGQYEQVVGGTAVTWPSQSVTIQVGASNGLKVTDIVVKAVHKYEGDAVTRSDDLLFELDDRPFRQAVREQEDAVAAAKATLERTVREIAYNKMARELEVESAKSEIEFRESDLKGRTMDFKGVETLKEKVKGYANNYDYARALFYYAQARYLYPEAKRRLQRATDALSVGLLRDTEVLAQATQQLEAAKGALELARRDLQRCQIRCPIDGFVDVVNLVPGAVITTDTPLTQVHKLDPLFIRMDYPQERIDEVYVGQQAEVVLDSLPQENFYGTVIRISPQVHTALRVLPVVIKLSNPGNRIKSGITSFVRLKAIRKVTVVPGMAVIQRVSKAMVFRIEEGRARIREVRTGHVLHNRLLEVREGLAPGDEVVVFHNFYHVREKDLVSGYGYLRDYDPVDVNWRKWAGRE